MDVLKCVIQFSLILSFAIGVLSSPKIIIIGAGSAGIAAATRLLEKNFTDIIVLEAEDRIGGRVHSAKFGDAFIDLGAEWCHGEKDNVVYDLVKDLNVLGQTESRLKFFQSSRYQIEPEFSDELYDLFSELYYPGGNKNQREGITVGDYFIAEYNKRIQELYLNDTRKLQIAQQALDSFHHLILTSEGSFSWFDTAVENDYRDCEGNLELNWGGFGYKTALETLMKRVSNNGEELLYRKLILNKEVIRILWDNNRIQPGKVTVKCLDGSTYHADHAILTTSLGVLKDRYKRFFYPKLPENKKNAIRELGIGGVMKIAYYFPTKWWPEDNFTGYSFIWTESDKQAVFEESHGWVVDFIGVFPVEKNPNVLMGWITGYSVPLAETLSDRNINDGTMFVLDKFLGHRFNLMEPEKIIKSNWFTNSHFKGCYTFQTTTSRRRKVSGQAELARPLITKKGNATLLFAGEATHSYYYSTVHGAIETGQREADRIVGYYS